MSAAPSVSSFLTPELLVVLLLVLIVVRRTVRQVQGAPFSVTRLVVFAAVYVLLFVALASATLLASVATWGTDADALLLPYGAVPVLAAFFAAPYVERVVQFERREDGQWYYRLSWHIPVLFLALFLTRVVAELAVFGPSGAVPSFPPPPPPSTAALYVLIAVDLLFGLSLGLMTGRGLGVVRAHRALPADPAAPPPSPPLPSG